MKKLLVLLFFSILFAKEPSFTLKTAGPVTDLVVDNNILFASTDSSEVDIFDLKTKKLINKINIDKIKDFMGDIIDSKIYSIDKLGDDILILSQGNGGFRRIDIYNLKTKKFTHIITKQDRMYISKAKFIDKNTLLLGLLSNILISFDIKTKNHNWEIQVTESKFSNFIINENKTKVVTTDESGDLHMLDLKNGKILKTFSGLNVDNVFQVDWKKDVIATAGQDRRCAVFTKNSSYYKQVNFLIYSVGVSPSAKFVAFASDEENNVTIFDVETRDDLYKLTKNKATISNIVFLNDNEIIVSSDSDTINYYKLK